MSSPRANLLQDLDMAMRRASSQTVLFSQAVASRLGLHPTDLGTLDILTREGRLTAGRLAELTGLSTAATTSLIDRLERSGFARRVRDPVDRRKVFVEVDEDRAIRDILPLYAAFSEALARMSRAYSDDELARFRDFARDSYRILLEETKRVWDAAVPSGHDGTRRGTDRT